MREEIRGEQPAGAQPESGGPDDWYVSLNGDTQTGPLSKQRVEQMIQEGRLGPEALCWRDGWTDWTALCTVGEFSGALAQARSKVRDALAEKAREGWDAVKSALRKGADEAARTARKAQLYLKITSREKKCNRAFMRMGKNLYERGDAFLSHEDYEKQRQEVSALLGEIARLRKKVEELE